MRMAKNFRAEWPFVENGAIRVSRGGKWNFAGCICRSAVRGLSYDKDTCSSILSFDTFLMRKQVYTLQSTPSGPTQWFFQGPPAEIKLLALIKI